MHTWQLKTGKCRDFKKRALHIKLHRYNYDLSKKGMVSISIIGGGGYKIIRICSAVCKKMISLMQSVCLPICPQPFWLQRSEEQHSKHIVR